MNTLSNDDITVLCEALEVWENKDLAGNLMGDLFEAMLSKGEDKEKYELARLKRQHAQEQLRQRRKDRSVLLRAKLLNLKAEQGIREIESEINKGLDSLQQV